MIVTAEERTQRFCTIKIENFTYKKKKKKKNENINQACSTEPSLRVSLMSVTYHTLSAARAIHTGDRTGGPVLLEIESLAQQ
jgi:hypothetical protein